MSEDFTFTPHPGSARDAVDKMNAAAEPKPAPAATSLHTAKPVKVEFTAAPDGVWRTMVLQPGQTRQLMPQDPNRVRAVIVASTGIASKTYASSGQSYGTVTSPAATTSICTVASQPAGTYQINWAVELTGTLSSSDVDNASLTNATTTLTIVEATMPGSAGLYPQQAVIQTVTETTSFRIRTDAAGTTDSVYSAQLVVTPLYSTGTGVSGTTALESNFVILCETQALAQSANNQASGTPYPDGFMLPGNVEVETRNRGLVWAVNPNSSAVQISVLTERHENS
jgi:hypothetical protein